MVIESNNSNIPHMPKAVKDSFQNKMPKKSGINKEKEAIMLVNAIGPVASALKPLCIEIQRESPYPIPKSIVGK